MTEPDKTSSGWVQDGRIHWVRKAFPEEVELLLFDNKTDTTDETSENGGGAGGGGGGGGYLKAPCGGFLRPSL